MINNDLYHHGIKGMRWGVRKKPSKKRGKQKLNAEKQSQLLKIS